jgi:hypothetical protein
VFNEISVISDDGRSHYENTAVTLLTRRIDCDKHPVDRNIDLGGNKIQKEVHGSTPECHRNIIKY